MHANTVLQKRQAGRRSFEADERLQSRRHRARKLRARVGVKGTDSRTGRLPCSHRVAVRESGGVAAQVTRAQIRHPADGGVARGGACAPRLRLTALPRVDFTQEIPPFRTA